jgi:phosphoesterase RecJ-like protein
MNLLGIATDTGFFKYQNADVLVFKDVTELIEKGANISDISNTILDNIPLEQIYLYKDVISNLKLALNGQIAYSLLSLNMLSKYNVLPKDSPSFVENLRSIRGVEIAIVFQEYAKGSYHVSLRSKKWADVSKIALNFGGGGHPRAAGFSVETNDIRQTMEEIVDTISKTIANHNPNLAFQ